MQITLRRAANLKAALMLKITELRSELSDTNVDLNVFDTDPVVQLNSANEEWNRKFLRFSNAVRLYGELRRRIGLANANVGINDTLTLVASIKLQLGAYQQFAKSSPRLSDEQLNSRIVGARDLLKTASSYGRQEITSFSFLPDDVIKELAQGVDQLKLNMMSLQDDLDRLNSTTIIELTEAEETLLKSEFLI